MEVTVIGLQDQTQARDTFFPDIYLSFYRTIRQRFGNASLLPAEGLKNARDNIDLRLLSMKGKINRNYITPKVGKANNIRMQYNDTLENALIKEDAPSVVSLLKQIEKTVFISTVRYHRINTNRHDVAKDISQSGFN